MMFGSKVITDVISRDALRVEKGGTLIQYHCVLIKRRHLDTDTEGKPM